MNANEKPRAGEEPAGAKGDTQNQGNSPSATKPKATIARTRTELMLKLGKQHFAEREYARRNGAMWAELTALVQRQREDEQRALAEWEASHG